MNTRVSTPVGHCALILLFCALFSALERSVAAAPSCYSGSSASVTFTQYWIPQEGANDVDDDGNVILLSGPATESIITDDGTLIENTDENTYNKCVEEGTCLLLNDDLVNTASTQTTFEVLDKEEYPYGEGSGAALVPFVSVAANDVSQGTTLLVTELQNYKLPNGETHNGCVRVDDTGVDFSCHIDWFVSSYSNEAQMTNLPEEATVEVSSCQVLSYV